MEHGEVDLAVPGVGRRVDQPRPALVVDEDVPRPQVAVHPHRRLGRTGPLGQVRARSRSTSVRARGSSAPRRAGPVGERGDPALDPEGGPVGGRRRVALRLPPDEAVAMPPERRHLRRVQAGEGAAEPLVGARPRRARRDPGDDEHVRGHGQDLGHGHAVDLAQPAEALGLDVELLLGQARGRLGEHAPAAVELDAGGLADATRRRRDGPRRPSAARASATARASGAGARLTADRPLAGGRSTRRRRVRAGRRPRRTRRRRRSTGRAPRRDRHRGRSR